MPTKPNRRPRPELLFRNLIVERSSLNLGTNPSSTRNSPHWAYIQMVGHLDEPLKGISDARLQVSASDDKTEKAVGAIIAIKPHVQFVVGMATRQFDLMWSLAVANRCKAVRLVFEAPKRGSALISSWSASTELPDKE